MNDIAASRQIRDKNRNRQIQTTLCKELISPIKEPSRVVMYASSTAFFRRILFMMGEMDFLNCFLDNA